MSDSCSESSASKRLRASVRSTLGEANVKAMRASATRVGSAARRGRVSTGGHMTA